MFAVAVGALMMAALVAAAVCLHRSFTAVDNYFASHVQQVRIMDYLSREPAHTRHADSFAGWEQSRRQLSG